MSMEMFYYLLTGYILGIVVAIILCAWELTKKKK